jgi:hypothetical protein
MIATTKRQLTLLAATVMLLGSAVSARANYVFNFSGLTASNSDQSTAIATYMDGVIGCSGCVTVSGPAGSGLPGGVAVDTTYTGDGHVVGPGGVSLTLGDSVNATNNGVTPGATENFIANTTNNSTPLSSEINITFSKGVSLTGTFSFSYEIFPDGTCSALTAAACGGSPTGGIYPNQPDLDFIASGGSTSVNTTFYGVAPGTTNGPSLHSPNSGLGSTELAPQLIGTYSVSLHGATSLSFVDWPATIGVGQMQLTSTPEPRGGVFLLGALALAALAGTRLRRAPAKS